MGKIKSFIGSEKGRNILIVLIILLVGLASFELGRLSKNSSSGLEIEYGSKLQAVTNSSALKAEVISAGSTPKTTKAEEAGEEGYFASKRGKKYYPINCSAGKTIKMENRIYYASRADAEAAGYELSSSCR